MPYDFAVTFGNKKGHTHDYVPLETTGWGPFAEVKLAWLWLTGTQVAVKTISQRGFAGEFQEVKSLKRLHHPNIVALFDNAVR